MEERAVGGGEWWCVWADGERSGASERASERVAKFLSCRAEG